MELDTSSTGQARKNNRRAHPPHRFSSIVDVKDAEERPISRANFLKTLDNEFGEPSVSPSRKSMPCRLNAMHLENNGVLKRGSVYQSSKEVRKLISQREVRRKPELAASDESFLSFEIVKRPSSHCKSSQKKRNPPHNFTSSGNASLDLSFRLLPEDPSKWKGQRSDVSLPIKSSSEEYLENSLIPEISEVHGTLQNLPLSEPKFRSSDHVSSSEKPSGTAHMLPKSFSAKVGTCSTPLHTEIDQYSNSQKNRFSPIRKMWDPMKKSMSQRDPSLSNTTSSKRDPPSQKPPLSCLSVSIDHQNKSEGHDQLSASAYSAAYLHGTIKLESKQSSSPCFEFSLIEAEEFLSCKTWRAKDALNWVYTFQSGKRNSGGGWSSKDRRRQTFPVVGQMHASCCLSSQMSTDGSMDYFAVAEFILQDISHLKNYPSPDLQSGKEITFKDPKLLSDSETRKNHSRVAAADSGSQASHPQLEIAAVVIQLPFDGKRPLRQKLGVEVCKSDTIKSRHVSMKVVTSSGKHGLPLTEDIGPSPLLDRWRSGGVCDCGGWDMGCPITILGDDSAHRSSTMINGKHLSLKLFVQVYNGT